MGRKPKNINENNDFSKNRNLQRTPYAEIARLYNMSETGAQNVVKSAFNKIFSNMLKMHSDVFDILTCMCDYFGMTEAELIRKLDERNLSVVKNYAKKNYETNYYEKQQAKK